MNQDQIMEVMNYIDPALIESADVPESAVRRVKWPLPTLIAACLCLVLAGTAVAVNSSRVQLIWLDSDSEEKAEMGDDIVYAVKGGITYYSLDRFSEEATAPELRKTGVSKSFKAWDELEEYLGVDIYDNPLLDTASRGVSLVDLYMKETPTNILLVNGYSSDGLCSIQADNSYVLDGICVNTSVQIYTEAMQSEVEESEIIPSGMTGGENIKVSMKELYTTPGGLEITITQRDIDFSGKPLKEYWAYFSKNGILFYISAKRMHLNYAPEDIAEVSDHTLTVLKEVLDAFTFPPAE